MLGELGVHLTTARLADLAGDVSTFDASVERLLLLADRYAHRLEACLHVGAAGYVRAAKWLLGRSRLSERTRLRIERMHDDARRALVSSLARPPTSRAGAPLGMAFGVSGVLHALLESGPLDIASSEAGLIRARIDELLALAVVDDGLVAWPESVGAPLNDGMWGSWCNGVPGFALLFVRAYRVFGEPAYLEIARLCAQTLVELRVRVPTLCCGSAGQALALLRVAEVTNEPAWRERARERCGDAIGDSGASRELGFLYGRAGVYWLAWMMREGRSPVFPLLESEEDG